LICEVKTGAFDEAKLFRPENLRYAIGRLGLIEPEEIVSVANALAHEPIVELNRTTSICKLLLATEYHKAGIYVARSLAAAEDFLAERVRRYPQEKFADRMFFPSELFQFVIAQVHRKIERRAT
jgi:hypothetical protein